MKIKKYIFKAQNAIPQGFLIVSEPTSSIYVQKPIVISSEPNLVIRLPNIDKEIGFKIFGKTFYKDTPQTKQVDIPVADLDYYHLYTLGDQKIAASTNLGLTTTNKNTVTLNGITRLVNNKDTTYYYPGNKIILLPTIIATNHPKREFVLSSLKKTNNKFYPILQNMFNNTNIKF